MCCKHECTLLGMLQNEDEVYKVIALQWSLHQKAFDNIDLPVSQKLESKR